ncbi:MAG: PAS domain S-box protein [Gammaproteobacteria bacterium]|nr:PAS domain S-box protein [Gammaproteobacteria bacterium]
MAFSLAQISLLFVLYLSLLYGIAYSADKGLIPASITHSPLVMVLSLGIFASAWTYYGVVDLAFQFGYGALAYYLGTGALFLFAPLLLTPMAILACRFQINNIADLMVFRYHSLKAGRLVTACMALIFLPLMVLQLQAVADTMQILTQNSAADTSRALAGLSYRETLALLFCFILAGFTLAFGGRRETSNGLVVAMAFESLFKIGALFTIGGLALYGVFGGFNGLDQWLLEHPENLELLHNPIKDNSANALLLVFLGCGIAMPHIFNVSRSEAQVRQISGTISWVFPLLLLLLALPIFPILWAGFAIDVPLPAQYFTLGVPMQLRSESLTLLAFLGGLSAASVAMIALCLALASMILNHWLIPITGFGRRALHRQLFWLRGAIVLLMFTSGFLFYKVLNNNFSLTDLALLAFIESLQLLPGVLAVNYWPKANSRGFLAGLGLGTGLWLVGLVLPAITDTQALYIPGLDTSVPLGIDYWSEITTVSITLNTLVFALISLFTRSTAGERYSAELSAEEELSHPLRMILQVHSAEDFAERLSESLGPSMANQEVRRALKELQISENERRPYTLRRLRNKLEANLSGLIGTAVAKEVLDKQLPYHLPEETNGTTTDINLIENRLRQYRSHLTGLAAELNNLRLYHRNTLEELPLAACSLGQNNEILMWNFAMEKLTGVAAETVVGSYLSSLYGPWIRLLADFSDSPHHHLHKEQIEIDGRLHWISLHKASIHGPAADIADGQIILLEDMTEIQLLERELMHTERLASVGRLAAGVAHEIGNPITGIACLAQNLRYETDDPEATLETADQILSQTDRVSRIVHSLVSFSHSGQSSRIEYLPVQLRDCANEALQLLALQKDEKQVNIRNLIDAGVALKADPQKLIQVFINLLSNARDASPGGSEIRITAACEGGQVTFNVIDEGSGIPTEDQERVLEPFYTTKDPGQGTGLGLALVYSIVEEHKGQIEVISPPPEQSRGTQISIKLPLNLETEVDTGNTSSVI